jgi:CDP-glycerol glycerophosphotransferase
MVNTLEQTKRMIILCVIHLFNLLPIKNNKIFLYSYYGAQYGCNPKYITEYILENTPKGQYELVWAFNELESKKHLTDIHKVKTMSIKYFYQLCTSKVIITNFRTTDFFVKRKSQYYIQTWHSSLRLKQIEKDAEASLPPQYLKMAQKDSSKLDLLLSGCRYSSEIFRRAFWYDGEIFEHGIPRVDSLIKSNEEKSGLIKNKLGIPKHFKILLYAPTFRNNHSLESYNLDFENLIHALKERYGGEWKILIRLHPHLMNESSKLKFSESIKDVTNYDDLLEILQISDVLVSDYSSLIFDYCITNRPCFLFTPDLNEYIANERKLYFDIEKLPFEKALSTSDLINKIKEFDERKYKYKMSLFLKEIQTYECGNASEYLLKKINKVCIKHKGVV